MVGGIVSLTRNTLPPDMVCYEGKGVPADIYLLNKRADIEKGSDPLVTRAVNVLKEQDTGL